MPKTVNTYGWQCDRITECDRCHHETACCAVDFNDGSHEWDYCEKCWTWLSENTNALDPSNWI